MLTAATKGPGSNPEEGMDVCKYIVPVRHGSTPNGLRATRHLVRLVEGKLRWETSDHLQGVLPLNWGRTELNRTVTCIVIRLTTSMHLTLCHEEFRGPRSDTVI
ncbi:uncharacterized protein TNCV_4581311 [Trichonephila clavipes]|nr:uncharacterized protein TNCV_4581311 [Trichonephila clavipes]